MKFCKDLNCVSESDRPYETCDDQCACRVSMTVELVEGEIMKITIPADIMEKWGVSKGEELYMYVMGDELIIRPRVVIPRNLNDGFSHIKIVERVESHETKR